MRHSLLAMSSEHGLMSFNEHLAGTHCNFLSPVFAVLTVIPRALQSGAKHVYGIECSAIADQAQRIVSDNGFADRVTIIKGKVSVSPAVQ